MFATETFSGGMAFGDLISFDGSFDYDASMGNLIVDIQRVGGAAQGVGLQGVFGPAGQVFDRAYSFGSNASADGLNEHYGNRTQFQFGALNSVPEPTTLALVAAAMLMLGASARRGAADRA